MKVKEGDIITIEAYVKRVNGSILDISPLGTHKDREICIKNAKCQATTPIWDSSVLSLVEEPIRLGDKVRSISNDKFNGTVLWTDGIEVLVSWDDIPVYNTPYKKLDKVEFVKKVKE